MLNSNQLQGRALFFSGNCACCCLQPVVGSDAALLVHAALASAFAMGLSRDTVENFLCSVCGWRRRRRNRWSRCKRTVSALATAGNLTTVKGDLFSTLTHLKFSFLLFFSYFEVSDCTAPESAVISRTSGPVCQSQRQMCCRCLWARPLL